MASVAWSPDRIPLGHTVIEQQGKASDKLTQKLVKIVARVCVFCEHALS